MMNNAHERLEMLQQMHDTVHYLIGQHNAAVEHEGRLRRRWGEHEVLRELPSPVLGAHPARFLVVCPVEVDAHHEAHNSG